MGATTLLNGGRLVSSHYPLSSPCLPRLPSLPPLPMPVLSLLPDSVLPPWLAPAAAATPTNDVHLFPMDHPLRGKRARQSGPCRSSRHGRPLRSCQFLTDNLFFILHFPSLLRPFASSPIRRLSLFAVPDRPRLGSPRFNMHQNHNPLASHLRLPRNFAFRHAASIAYTP